MYCPNCGAEATPGLNYCKRCGGSLTQLSIAQEIRPAVSAASVWAVGVTTLFLVVGGLAVLFGLLTDMVHSGLIPHVIVWLAALGALTILGSVALLMRFWMRLLSLRSPQSVGGQTQLKNFAAVSELGPARTGPFPDPLGSVTEHTTRTFEPSYREPQK